MSFDALVDGVVGILALVAGWIVAQWSKLRGEVRANEQAIAEIRTRAAVLEAKHDSVPSTLREIKDEIKGLREDVTTELRSIHARVDQKADRSK